MITADRGLIVGKLYTVPYPLSVSPAPMRSRGTYRTISAGRPVVLLGTFTTGSALWITLLDPDGVVVIAGFRGTEADVSDWVMVGNQ